MGNFGHVNRGGGLSHSGYRRGPVLSAPNMIDIRSQLSYHMAGSAVWILVRLRLQFYQPAA
jgi:hypothetical protein